ncbi:MAG: IS200/IS605 family transposase [Pyrinomonadaceae bacterium]
MPQSLVNQILHCVFSTKERRKLISPEIAERLYPYFGGIARKNKMKLIAVGGMKDHIHLLVSLPSTISISKAMQSLKGNSSKWMHETYPELKLFEWQRGYGAFSIGVSDLERTTNYINNQAKHHKNHSFEDEYLAFVRKNGLEYDEKYVFD